MKKNIFLVLAFFIMGGLVATESCKSKKDKTTTEQPSTPPVEISSDEQLRTSVNTVIADYKDVKASVSNGIVTLTGSIEQENLQKLIMRLQELKPKKVENQLVIK